MTGIACESNEEVELTRQLLPQLKAAGFIVYVTAEELQKISRDTPVHAHVQRGYNEGLKISLILDKGK